MIRNKSGTLRTIFLIFALVAGSALNTGCASFGKSLKAFLGGKTDEERLADDERKRLGPRFSETDSMQFRGPQRQYKRMNRQRFEDEAELHSNAGSLWVMEGQGAYLFAQNTTRMVGDLLNVTIDGAPRNQLATKVRVIAKLLERLDRPAASAIRQPAGAAAGAAATPAPAAPGAENAAGGAQPGNAQGAGGAADGEPNFPVQVVPTRIVELLRDGNYRVKGSETFMIGKREYRVIVTGIVRPEDFNDEGISATKLLDPQFDIVSSKRGASTL